MARKKGLHTMHLDGPLDGELFMKREGINPDKTPDDEPEWLDNDKDDDTVEDEDLDDEDGPDYDADEED